MGHMECSGFLLPDPDRRRHKLAHLRKILHRVDYLSITETHGTPGSLAAWQPPTGYAAWWSPGHSTGRAGIGLIVAHQFLRALLPPPRWREVWPGRAAFLTLEGPQGRLDI